MRSISCRRLFSSHTTPKSVFNLQMSSLAASSSFPLRNLAERLLRPSYTAWPKRSYAISIDLRYRASTSACCLRLLTLGLDNTTSVLFSALRRREDEAPSVFAAGRRREERRTANGGGESNSFRGDNATLSSMMNSSCSDGSGVSSAGGWPGG
jgi:hypothetical protein